MWLLIIVTLITGTDGGARSSVTTLQFSTAGLSAANAGADPALCFHSNGRRMQSH